MGNQNNSAMQLRVQEMRIFLEKIELRIENERSQTHPNLTLIKRLEYEYSNLEDTLKQALKFDKSNMT